MRNVYEVLREKEADLARTKREVEALRIVAPLLNEPMGDFNIQAKPEAPAQPPAEEPVAAGAEKQWARWP